MTEAKEMGGMFKGAARNTAAGVSLAATMTAALLSGTPAQAATTCQVTNGSTSFVHLQLAIDDAHAGDTLVIGGTCMGSFLVDKPLTLAGQPGAVLRQKPFVSSPTLITAANPVEVRDLTIILPAPRTGEAERDAIFNFDTLILSHSVVVNDSTCCLFAVGIKNQGNLSVIDGSELHWGSKTDDVVYYDIWNVPWATMNLTDSAISGGTFDIYNEGVAHVERSTISGGLGIGNDAGGIWNQDGSLTVDDSTIMNNASINNEGFGIHNEGGFVEVTRSTIAHNVDDNNSEGGIKNYGGHVTVAGSILALNGRDCTGRVISLGYNLVRDAGPDCLFAPRRTDQVGTRAGLEPLAFNGGPTQTALLTPRSPALDRIPIGATAGSGGMALCPATGGTDQRGVGRPQGSRCDVGAVEVTPST